jgi:HipA-like protein
MHVDYHNLIAVDAYIESGKSRIFVGRLTQKEDGFVFEYDSLYLRINTAVSIGVELPLTRKNFTSKSLFASLLDRIPSRKNPAYGDYCSHFGIKEEESNLLILLATIGSRGPSSIVFEPVFPPSFRREDLKEYRVAIGLSTREFALLFDISASTLNRIENGTASGRDIMRRMEIYAKFPNVALFEINRNRPYVHRDTFYKAETYLKGLVC